MAFCSGSYAHGHVCESSHYSYSAGGVSIITPPSKFCPHIEVVALIRLKAFPACKKKTRYNLSEQAVKYSEKCFVQISQRYNDIWRSENVCFSICIMAVNTLYPDMHKVSY